MVLILLGHIILSLKLISFTVWTLDRETALLIYWRLFSVNNVGYQFTSTKSRSLTFLDVNLQGWKVKTGEFKFNCIFPSKHGVKAELQILFAKKGCVMYIVTPAPRENDTCGLVLRKWYRFLYTLAVIWFWKRNHQLYFASVVYILCQPSFSCPGPSLPVQVYSAF